MDISHLTLPTNVKLLHEIENSEISKLLHNINGLNQTEVERIVYVEVPKKSRVVFTMKDFDNHVLLTSLRVLQVRNGAVLHAIPYSRLLNVCLSIKKSFFGKNKVTCEQKSFQDNQSVVNNGQNDANVTQIEFLSDEKGVLTWLSQVLECMLSIITESVIRGDSAVPALTHKSLPSIIPMESKTFKIGITYPLISTAYFFDIIEYALVEKQEKFFFQVPESRLDGLLSKLIFKPTISIYSTHTPSSSAKFQWICKRTEEVSLPCWIHGDVDFQSTLIANFKTCLECIVTPLNDKSEYGSELRVMFTMRVSAPESVVSLLLSLGDSDDEEEEAQEIRNSLKKVQASKTSQDHSEQCVVSISVGSLFVDMTIMEHAPFMEAEVVNFGEDTVLSDKVTAHNGFLHCLREVLKPNMGHVVDEQGYDFGKLGSRVSMQPLLLLINEPLLTCVGQSMNSVQTLASTGLKYHGSTTPGLERQLVIIDHVPEVERTTSEEQEQSVVSPKSSNGVGKTILNGLGSAFHFFGEALSKLPLVGGPTEYVEETDNTPLATYVDTIPPYMINLIDGNKPTEIVPFDFSMTIPPHKESSAVWDVVYEFQMLSSGGWVTYDNHHPYFADKDALTPCTMKESPPNPLWEYKTPWRVPLAQEAIQVIAATILKEESAKEAQEKEGPKKKKMVKKKNILLRGILGIGNKQNGAAEEIIRGVMLKQRDNRYKTPDLRMQKESFGYVVNEDCEYLTWEYNGKSDTTPSTGSTLMSKLTSQTSKVSEQKTEWHGYYRPGDMFRRRMLVRPRRYLSAHNPCCDCEFCWMLTTVCQEEGRSHRERNPFGELMMKRQTEFFIMCIDFIAQELQTARRMIQATEFEKLLSTVDWRTIVSKIRCLENVLEHGRLYQFRTVSDTGMLVSWIPQTIEKRGDEMKDAVFDCAMLALGWYFPLLKPNVVQECMMKSITPDEYVNTAQNLQSQDDKIDVKTARVNAIHNNAAVLMQLFESYAAVDRTVLNRTERDREEAVAQGYVADADSNSNDSNKDTILHTIGCPYMYKAGEELRLPQQEYEFSEDLVKFPTSTLTAVPASVSRSLRIQLYLVCSLLQDYDSLFHPMNIALPPALPPASVYADCNNLVHAQDPTAEYSPIMPVCSQSCARATLAGIQQQLLLTQETGKPQASWLYERKHSNKGIPTSLEWRNGSLESFLEEFPRRVSWIKRLVPVIEFINHMNVLPRSWNLSSIIFRSLAYIDETHLTCAFAAANIVTPLYFKNPSAALAQHPLYRNATFYNSVKHASQLVTQHPHLVVKASLLLGQNVDASVREAMPYVLQYGKVIMDEIRPPTWSVPFTSPLVSSNLGSLVYSHPCTTGNINMNACSKLHCEYHSGGKHSNVLQLLSHLQQSLPKLQTLITMFHTVLETQMEMKKKYPWLMPDTMKPNQRYLWNMNIDYFTPYLHQRLLSTQLKSNMSTVHSLDQGLRHILWVARHHLITSLENSLRMICEREVVYVTGQSLHTTFLGAWEQLGPLQPDQPWGKHPLQSVLPPALLAPNSMDLVMYPVLYGPFLKVLKAMGVALPYEDASILQDSVETYMLNHMNSAVPHGPSPYTIQSDLCVEMDTLVLNSAFQLFGEIKQNTLTLASLSKHYKHHVPRFAADCVLLVSAYVSHLLHLLGTPMVQPPPALCVKALTPRTIIEEPSNTKAKILKFFANDEPIVPVETWWNATDATEDPKKYKPCLIETRPFMIDTVLSVEDPEYAETNHFPISEYRAHVRVVSPLSPMFDLGAYTHSLSYHYSLACIDSDFDQYLLDYALQGRSLSSQSGLVTKTSTRVDPDGAEVIHKYAVTEELKFNGHSCSIMDTYSWNVALSIATTAMRTSEQMCDYLSFIEQHCGGSDVFVHLLAYDKYEHQVLDWNIQSNMQHVTVGEDKLDNDPILSQGEYMLDASSKATQTAIQILLTHLVPAVSGVISSSVMNYRSSYFSGSQTLQNTADWKSRFLNYMRGESTYDTTQSGYTGLEGNRMKILKIRKADIVKKKLYTPTVSSRKETPKNVLPEEEFLVLDDIVYKHVEEQPRYQEPDEKEDSHTDNSDDEEEDLLAYYLQAAGLNSNEDDDVVENHDNTNSTATEVKTTIANMSDEDEILNDSDDDIAPTTHMMSNSNENDDIMSHLTSTSVLKQNNNNKYAKKTSISTKPTPTKAYNPFDDDDDDADDHNHTPSHHMHRNTSTNPFDDDVHISTNPFEDNYISTNPFDDEEEDITPETQEPYKNPFEDDEDTPTAGKQVVEDEEDAQLEMFLSDLLVSKPPATGNRNTITERHSTLHRTSMVIPDSAPTSLPTYGLIEQYPAYQSEAPSTKEAYAMQNVPFLPSDDMFALVRVLLGLTKSDTLESLPLAPSLTTVLFHTEKLSILNRTILTKFFTHIVFPALRTTIHTATKDITLRMIPTPVLFNALPPLLTSKDIQSMYACIPVPVRSLYLAATLPQQQASNLAALYSLSAFFATNSPDVVPPMFMLPKSTKPSSTFINDYAQTLTASTNVAEPFSFPLTKTQVRAQQRVYNELLRIFFPLEFVVRLSPYILYIATHLEQLMREEVSLSELYDTPETFHTYSTVENEEDEQEPCLCMLCTQDIPPIQEQVTPQALKTHMKWLFVQLNKAGVSHITLQWVARISKIPATTCSLLASLYAPITPNYKRYALIEF